MAKEIFQNMNNKADYMMTKHCNNSETMNDLAFYHNIVILGIALGQMSL